MQIKNTVKLFATAALLAGFVGSANAATIFVVDALATGQARGPAPDYGTNPTNATFDFSTGGDSAAGLSGTLSLDNVTSGFYETGLGSARTFNNGSASFISNGTATWTASGYTPGASVDVYAYWGGPQGNASSAASYSVNGGTAVVKDQRNATTDDLVLADPDGTGADFELLGSFTADGSGDVAVVLTPSGFTFVDAIAFVGAVPEPGSLALMGLGGLLMARRRRG